MLDTALAGAPLNVVPPESLETSTERSGFPDDSQKNHPYRAPSSRLEPGGRVPRIGLSRAVFSVVPATGSCILIDRTGAMVSTLRGSVWNWKGYVYVTAEEMLQPVRKPRRAGLRRPRPMSRDREDESKRDLLSRRTNKESATTTVALRVSAKNRLVGRPKSPVRASSNTSKSGRSAGWPRIPSRLTPKQRQIGIGTRGGRSWSEKYSRPKSNLSHLHDA